MHHEIKKNKRLKISALECLRNPCKVTRHTTGTLPNQWPPLRPQAPRSGPAPCSSSTSPRQEPQGSRNIITQALPVLPPHSAAGGSWNQLPNHVYSFRSELGSGNTQGKRTINFEMTLPCMGRVLAVAAHCRTDPGRPDWQTETLPYLIQLSTDLCEMNKHMNEGNTSHRNHIIMYEISKTLQANSRLFIHFSKHACSL